MAQSLQGGGPYTVFAPTDQAFEQLLLQYHVIEGKELSAKDIIGQQTEVDTLAGDSLSVDGSGQMVLLVPTGRTPSQSAQQSSTF
jgi:uncharacterized surface protein with fasciclin (FAS1) repeats